MTECEHEANARSKVHWNCAGDTDDKWGIECLLVALDEGQLCRAHIETAANPAIGELYSGRAGMVLP